jgi:hypothetical protein
MSRFENINSWFATRNKQKEEICNSEIHLQYKIPILGPYFTASQNGTTRQTDEFGARDGYP